MNNAITKIRELQKLSEKELRDLRKTNGEIDELMTELYKLIDLDRVRNKAIKKQQKIKTRKRPKAKKNL